jgi:predicted O-linked N-acetylglucosamine transferase (SPINDLY family)
VTDNNDKRFLSKEQIDGVISLYSDGKIIEAIEATEQLNKEYPNVPILFNILGVCYKSLQQLDVAVKMFKTALKIKRDYAEAHKNLGITLKDLGNFEEAILSLKQAINMNPNYIDAHYNLAATYTDLGKLNDAQESYQKVIELNPSITEAHNNLANILKELGHLEAALESYQNAFNLNPNSPEIHNNIANTLKDLGQLENALESYEKALKLNPKFAEAYYNKGIVLKKLRKLDDAVVDFKNAISNRPDFAEAYNNLGSALHALGQTNEAIQYCEKALSINPNYAEGYNNFGNIFKDLRRSNAAKKYYEKAIEIKPDYAEAIVNLASIYSDKKNRIKALQLYEKAYEIDSGMDFLIGDILNTKMNLCIWDSFSSEIDELVNGISNKQKTIGPFPLLSIVDNPLFQLKSSTTFVDFYYPKNNVLSDAHSFPNHSKIKIGYFSADFKQHPVATLTAELYELHDRSQFEVHAFSFGPDTNDEMNLRIKAGVDYFHNVINFSHKDVVNLSRHHEIDIAVDLGGFTAKSRTEIFAMSAAAIQISYIGYLGTMGAEYYDYLIADEIMIPEENQQFFSEKIVYLPSFQVNDSKETPPDIYFSRKDLGLPEDGFVFCCFNNTYKITPHTFDSWARILSEVDKSVLMIYVNNEFSQKNLIKEIIARGIDPKRLVFGDSLPRPEYLARYRVADLFLDTAPYNAGTTASDALRMGLPVLTVKGNAYPSRMASSILNAVNLPELITHSQEEYESLAIDLANNPDKLNKIKDKLSANLKTAPLYNTKLFTKNLETAYLKMYERHHKGLKPDHIIIDEH